MLDLAVLARIFAAGSVTSHSDCMDWLYARCSLQIVQAFVKARASLVSLFVVSITGEMSCFVAVLNAMCSLYAYHLTQCEWDVLFFLHVTAYEFVQEI